LFSTIYGLALSKYLLFHFAFIYFWANKLAPWTTCLVYLTLLVIIDFLLLYKNAQIYWLFIQWVEKQQTNCVAGRTTTKNKNCFEFSNFALILFFSRPRVRAIQREKSREKHALQQLGQQTRRNGSQYIGQLYL